MSAPIAARPRGSAGSPAGLHIPPTFRRDDLGITEAPITKGDPDMRWFPRVLAILLLIIGLGAVGAVAYDAGFTAGLVQGATESGATIVTRYPYGGPGWGFGGLFGVLGVIVFLFLFLGLLRFAFGGPRGRGPGWGPGWHGRGGWGPGADHDRGHDRFGPWEDRAREVHDAWHRGQSHEPTAGSGPPAGGTAGRAGA
jgi:hypothetical protein